GQEQVPSAFLEEVRRLTGHKWSTRTLPPVLPLDEVLTPSELRRTVALEALAGLTFPSLRVTEPDPAGKLLKDRFGTDDWFRTARELAHMEAARLRFFGREDELPGEFTGGVQGPLLEQKLRDTFHFGLERPLSASALSKFGNCGFQGFIAYGLKVAEPVVANEEFDARGRGTFWHRVMEEVFQALKEKKLLGQAPEDIPEEVLEKAVKKASRHFAELYHVGHHELWKLAGEKAQAMARRILADPRHGLPFDPLVPEGFELRFGPAAEDKRWSDVKLMVAEDAIVFEGQIDRLDTAGVEVGVIDYKTGRLDKRTLKENLLRSDFQLPLYLYAARVAGHV
ncbi:MAG: PD-(D/E)XK nuclease family protein, partial [Myxococcaceae bacterium]